jgi:catechol 2,3-dioxygenase-like lactoylglutathione lyase family enzyme
MNSMIDSLFDQYESGTITRRHLLQALAAFALPASVVAQGAPADSAPIVRGLAVNHVALVVGDVERSYAFYHKLFGVKKGWPATNAGTGIHLDFPNSGYISVDSTSPKKGVITHFSVSVDKLDKDIAKRLADKINSEMPEAKARDLFQANDGVSTVNLTDPDGFYVQISPRTGR